MSKEHARTRFPLPIHRFTSLQGGQYGTVDLVALSRHELELRLGGDYVRFPTSRALELRNEIDRFLELGEEERDRDRDSQRPHHHHPSDGRVDVVARVEERVEERIEEGTRERGTRRKRA